MRRGEVWTVAGTVHRLKVGRYLGELDREDVLRLNRAVIVFLGLAD